ncbi:hypothetical protein JT163_04590, partial [Helicobacter pylori]|nr:hypothetical protein [Helicobacter pylori]
MKKIVVGWCVALAFLSADPAQADDALSHSGLVKALRDLKKIISTPNTEITNLRKVQHVLSA